MSNRRYTPHVGRLAASALFVLACDGELGPPDASAWDASAWDAGPETHDATIDDPDPVFSDAERAGLSTLRYDAAPPAIDPSNRVDGDEAARRFGQRLFFAPELSGPLLDGDNDGSELTLGVRGEAGRVSCAGCHIPDSGFVDTRSRGQQASLGARWSRRRTPQLAEVAFAPLFNWDGRRDSLWGQAMGVFESDRELNSSRLFIAQQIYRLHRAEYESIFGPMPPLDDEARFPAIPAEQIGCVVRPGLILECRGTPGDGAEYDAMAPGDQEIVTRVTTDVAKAVAAYVAELRCGESRFDAWLDGDESALTRAEQRGAALFAGRAGCIGCHSGPRLTDDRFHNVGLNPRAVSVVVLDANDRGAGAALPLLLADPLNTRGVFSDGERPVLPESIGPELEGAFRTPTLRCASGQPSFMHTAHLRTLEDVVAFFDRGGDPPDAWPGYPGTSEIAPLGLTERERGDLVAFLRALDGPGAPAELRVPPPPFSPADPP